jgi:hypothetical protein
VNELLAVMFGVLIGLLAYLFFGKEIDGFFNRLVNRVRKACGLKPY